MDEHRKKTLSRGSLRIGISGSAGVGKSTLAARLASDFGLRHIDEGMRRRLERGLDLHKLSGDQRRDLCEELLEELPVPI